MRTHHSESGFTITELIVASMITLAVIGVALTTFSNALSLNEMTTQVADSNQNLRAGTNLLVRDLLQTGRNISTGGISIPSGDGSVAIFRPSPPNKSYFFDNTTQTALQSITTGQALGPEIEGQPTDMVTLLMDDGVRDELRVEPSTFVGAAPKLAADGSSLNVGPALAWLTGDPVNGIPAIQAGDLIYFSNAVGTTIQTVTSVASPNILFEAGSADPFRFNQPGADAGSITQIMGSTMSVRRVLMFTYYVHNDSSGTPRLMRALNMYPPQALAGVIEDLSLSFDLVDGVYNPTNIKSLPYTSPAPQNVTYGASQARKANLHVGVRAEDKSARQQDYIRSHLSTIIDLRNLAFVDRYK
jgi:type II secretory pathway pseudopilin PulG